MNIIYDIETYPNCFTLAAEHADYPIRWSFEISDYRDDSRDLIDWVRWIKSQHGRMVGFKNIEFDYPVLHTLMLMGKGDAATLYSKAMAIIGTQDKDVGLGHPVIHTVMLMDKVDATTLHSKAMVIVGSQDDNRWQHRVYPSDRRCDQLDLSLIHHFDNKARFTGLKEVEFIMRMDRVVGLPFPVGSTLNREQIQILRKYNAYDVTATKMFYHESADMIRFREELTRKYNRDFMNHNDTKIGKDYFIMRLEEAGVQCYYYGTNGRTPRQTPRPTIALKDAILPWIQFEQPEFTRILNWLKSQTITETKGVFNGVVAHVNGFDFVFGLGGIHGSVTNENVDASDEFAIIDLDVTSYYPSLAIVNRFKPEHLTDTFCSIYETLKEQRVSFKKGSAENAMLKLALNGVYGDSNNKFSVFYDPLFTMSITLNGQLLLCLLAEWLMRVEGLRILQVNTDGLTVRVKREHLPHVEAVRENWENLTNLQLEETRYTRMVIADVNSYIAVKEDGGVKRKGRYEYDLEWHQNASSLVIPKVAEKVLLDGAPIRATIEGWDDQMDFMCRVKVPRSSKLLYVEDDVDTVIQNTTRYYVAKGGGSLCKLMPPLKGKTEWRRIGVVSGWSVCVCNDIKDAVLPIDYDYYVDEVEKLCLSVI